MTLLADNELWDLINKEELIIEPFDEKAFNPTSINLRLGRTLIRYLPQTIQFDKIPECEELELQDSGYKLESCSFILGVTKETVKIPNGYQGFIDTKGNIARAGLQIHNADGHIDPGFRGKITLEISNMHRENITILLLPDIYVCQLFIYKVSSKSTFPYHGKYSGHIKPTMYLP